MENGKTNIELFYVLKTQTSELKRWRFQGKVSGGGFRGRIQGEVSRGRSPGDKRVKSFFEKIAISMLRS